VPPRGRLADPAAQLVAERAAVCFSLDAVGEQARGCIACPDLAAERTSVVVGDFPERPRFVLVGEAPGAHEDAAGRPFIGKAGQLLDEVLAGVGVDRDTVAVANVLKCRPPANRQPTRAEARRCQGWLERQLALVDTPLVVTLGGTALAWALGHGVRLSDVRGRVHEWRDRLLVPTFHPSAAIRFGPKGGPLAALRADLALAAATTCPS